ncbi:hypothetical protein [Gilvimarinus sp. DA14]|uniref:hypothetical protein n=1 Tax=Gilvimarinus sp. DA14 TaxID=2956798 RepID=UPI0020B8DF99|nr:hypothetical protein [Gilvimarinus sp. DA14]UTF61841.1 hypothetical protein NHM04_08630 [Gilvimarinus sp. DA14]
MSLYQYCTRRPLLCLCSLVLLALGLLGTGLTLHYAKQQQNTQASRYGQAMAERAAAQAVEPALAQDMISLQVILQSLAAQPAVHGATVHDVENNLLVQAGGGNLATELQAAQFAAPITLDTHIAGHLTVTLALAPVHRLYANYLWIWSLVVLACIGALWLGDHYLAVYQARPPKVKKKPKPTPTEHDDTVAEQTFAMDGSEDDALPSEFEDEDESTTHYAVQVELHFLNLPALQQQLTKQGYELRLSRFKQQLQGILALYTGHQESFDDKCLRLCATADTRENAIFYGICISQLAVGLSESSDSPRLKLAASISESGCEQPPALTPYQIWLSDAISDSALSGYIRLSDTQLVEEIKPPYKALLERQQTQLMALPVTRRS